MAAESIERRPVMSLRAYDSDLKKKGKKNIAVSHNSIWHLLLFSFMEKIKSKLANDNTEKCFYNCTRIFSGAMDILVEQQNFESIVKPKRGGGEVSQRPLVLSGAPESPNQPNLKGKREKSSEV